MTTRIKKRLKVWGANLAGILCLALVPFIAPLPGPGGIPLIIFGLGLLALNNLWAKRLQDWAEKNLTSLSDLIFSDAKIHQRAWDIFIYLTLAAGIGALTWLNSLNLGSFDLGFMDLSHELIWQTVITTIMFFPLLAWFRNRYRWRRLVKYFGLRFSKYYTEDTMPTTAITLHQPWASLVAKGLKTIETRSWRPPEELIGQRLAIHAGKQLPPKPSNKRFGKAITVHLGSRWRTELPLGVIIATAKLEKIEKTTGIEKKTLNKEEVLFGDYSAGRWMWYLVDVRPVKPLLPARGYQGLWTLKQ